MKGLIRIVAGLAAGLVAVIAVIALIGSALPAEHIASRSILLPRSRREVYAVVRDFSSAPVWRSDIQRVEMLTLPGGKVGFREFGKHDAVTYEVSEDVPGDRIVTTIADTNLGYAGKWTYVFVDEGGGTRVTITEDGVVSNVIFRFMSRFVFGHSATIDAYLESLAKRMGDESATK